MRAPALKDSRGTLPPARKKHLNEKEEAFVDLQLTSVRARPCKERSFSKRNRGCLKIDEIQKNVESGKDVTHVSRTAARMAGP